MLRSRRAPRLPETHASHLGRADRVLAAAELADGTWAAVAPDALLVVASDGVRGRHAWHEIQQGTWDGDTRRLTITWVEGARAPLRLTTADDEVETFTGAVRERVQSSVVHVETERLPGGGVAQVHVRRGEGGELFSQLTVRGTLRGDAEEQQLIDDLEVRARAAVGMAT